MNHSTQEKEEIYPGSYIPSYVTESDMCSETSSAFASESTCTVSTTELNLYYKIVVPIPTAKKKNIIVCVEDHNAIITAYHECNVASEAAEDFTEKPEVFFRKTVKLPLDADADFMHAVYIKGVLHIFISKSNRPCNVQHHIVAVY